MSNLVAVGTTFKINSKSYVIIGFGRVNKTSTDFWIIQSLYDEGKRFRKNKGELEDTLKNYKSENINIFGKQ
jgi:hypothetical protein